MKKNSFSIILFLLISICSGNISLPPASGDGSIDSPFEITSIENLYWITENDERWDYHYIQTSDIDASETQSWFNGKGWKPIGQFYEAGDPKNKPFTGTYNGQNNIISNIYINRPEASYIGLFSAGNNTVISNLSLVNANITGGMNVGGFFGYISDNSTIDNCQITGSVTGTFLEGKVGGLAGEISHSIIQNSHNSAMIYGLQSVGGLTGLGFFSEINLSYNEGSVKSELSSWGVGGLVGDEFFSSINNSYSTSIVSGTNGIGGLVGMRFNSSINESWSSGVIRGKTGAGGLTGIDVSSTISNSYSTALIAGYYYAGGLSGFLTSEPPSDTSFNNSLPWEKAKRITDKYRDYQRKTMSSYTIKNSYSTGAVYGHFYVGGLVGFLTDNALVLNCLSKGEVKGSHRTGGLIGYLSESNVTNCYSIGNVIGEHDTGGLIGLQFQSFIENSYWNTSTSGQQNSDGGKGKTTSEMTFPYGENVYINWDFQNTWSHDEDFSFNDGYPFHKNLKLGSEEFLEPAKKSYSYNYPNPFNPLTNIFFKVNSPGFLKINIYNSRGQLIKHLFSGYKDSGNHTVKWNGTDNAGNILSSGIYLYSIEESESKKITGKMLMLK